MFCYRIQFSVLWRTIHSHKFCFSYTMSKATFSDLVQIFRSGVLVVQPDKLIRNSVNYNATTEKLIIAGDSYNLQNKDVFLVGTGKAVQNMAKELEKILGGKIKHGIVSIPDGSKSETVINKYVRYSEGAKNNLPDKNAEATAIKVKKLVSSLTSNDLLIVLISGGGSSLLPLPREPITLEEKCGLVKKLANAGADIVELNTVRKRISELKGGQLAMRAQPAQVVSLILSDIVGDPLDLIASGPTTENNDDPNAAADIIKKYNLYEQLPLSVKTILNELNDSKEFPKDKVNNYIIGSNKVSIHEAANQAEKLGYLPICLSHQVIGNIEIVAQEYVKLAELFCKLIEGTLNKEEFKSSIDSLNIPGISTNFIEDDKVMDLLKHKDVCLVLGGEITVEVKGKGKGGRNQQLSLEFSNIIHKIKGRFSHFEVDFLSAGTDGIDGPTDAAGAMGYLDLVSESKEVNIDINDYLNNSDSYNFYKRFKNGELHVFTGHTNTNVMDIHLIVIRKKK
ncbi:glycerate kinase [Ostrinia nubilalis]|uniref:glycerate kinase n=1 Tax=Ostrinia nubilalis TaxID=29057 RepID=UPI0030823D52